MAVVVADGERIAALPVAEGKPAFEVHLPHVVGLSRLGATVGVGVVNAGPAAASHTQAMSFGTPAIVLHAGDEAMPCLVSSITRSFFGPHVRCSRRSARISAVIASSVRAGLHSGREDFGSNALKPPSAQRFRCL